MPWPEVVNPLIKLRYSTHPIATKINIEYEFQVIKIMKVKYGWPADSDIDINMPLFVQRVIKMQLPDMLNDIRILTKAAPEIATSANFNCCYQLVRKKKPELAYEFFKSLSDEKNNKACMEVIDILAVSVWIYMFFFYHMNCTYISYFLFFNCRTCLRTPHHP